MAKVPEAEAGGGLGYRVGIAQSAAHTVQALGAQIGRRAYAQCILKGVLQTAAANPQQRSQFSHRQRAVAGRLFDVRTGCLHQPPMAVGARRRGRCAQRLGLQQIQQAVDQRFFKRFPDGRAVQQIGCLPHGSQHVAQHLAQRVHAFARPVQHGGARTECLGHAGHRFAQRRIGKALRVELNVHQHMLLGRAELETVGA